MLNEVKSIIVCGIIGGLFYCCGSSESENKSDDAQSLLEEAKIAVNNRDFEKAVTLIDSLNSAYPKAIAQRKSAMSIRPEAIVGKTMRQLEINDSTDASLQASRDSLMRYFTKIDKKGLYAPYFIHNGLAGMSIYNRTGVEPRISDEGSLSLITSVVGRNCQHTSVSLTAPDGTSVATPEASYDGERNLRENGTEMIVYSTEEAMPIAVFAKDNIGKNLTLRFNGKSPFSRQLSESEHRALAASASLAAIQSQIVYLKRAHSRLEQQLQLARDQAARTSGR